MGELAALEQIREDSRTLDRQSIPIGPFARLDAAAVAAQDGKTRGAITNLFGSQAAFQAETMELALNAEGWVEQIEFAAPADFTNAEEWLDAFLARESARGPKPGGKAAVNPGTLWALWLTVVPYGMWSRRVSRPSMAEHVQLIRRVEALVRDALDHFGLRVRDDTTIADLACAMANQIEGVWLNQCLTTKHPTVPDEPVATSLQRAGRLLWRGATEPDA
jgi:hypothetical protein